jgi:iron(III) transport system substrate-binding protein
LAAAGEGSMTSVGWTWLAAGAVALAIGTAQAQTKLTVYTAIEADQLKEYKQAFEKDNPDVKIDFVRDSTGIVTAKLLAEKGNPQADVVWGLAATSLMLLDAEGMLEPYAPKGLEKVDAKFRDPRTPPTWVGMDVWGATICFNTVEAGKKKLPKPASWKDLADPVYKGAITMPNPSSSGTGYLMVSSWIQMFGEQEAWKFMDALHENVAAYTHSGSKPCKQAGAGEHPIGISFEYRANKTKQEGAPVDLVFPKEGLGWDMEATGILKTTKKMDAAKKLADWAVSPQANALYAKGYAVVALPGVAKPLEYVPANYHQLLIKNDFGWAAKNRERILAEWTKRYDGKSEAKS